MEHNWSQYKKGESKTAAELETLFSNIYLTKFQKKAIKRAIKLANKANDRPFTISTPNLKDLSNEQR